MRKVLMFAVLALLAANFAWAQANDVGISVQAGPPMGPGTPFIGGASCPPAGQVDTAFTGATTQDGRIFRDAIASTCPSKVYPGIFNVDLQLRGFHLHQHQRRHRLRDRELQPGHLRRLAVHHQRPCQRLPELVRSDQSGAELRR